jgi:hypothetical protein
MGAALGGNNQLSGEIGSAEEKIGRTINQKFAKEPGSHLPGFFWATPGDLESVSPRVLASCLESGPGSEPGRLRSNICAGPRKRIKPAESSSFQRADAMIFEIGPRAPCRD